MVKKTVKRRVKTGGFGFPKTIRGYNTKDISEHAKFVASSSGFFASEGECAALVRGSLKPLGLNLFACQKIPKVTLYKMAHLIHKYDKNFSLVDAIRNGDIDLFKFALENGGHVKIGAYGTLSLLNSNKFSYFEQTTPSDKKQDIYEGLIIDALRIGKRGDASRMQFINYLASKLR